ncbi:folate-binding protein [Sandaracinobacter sp. RS1-74]|uniref:CAF17-like 4Fe-4S cluster assembly/insertion protein YgfZ n=1 Tax=Sandaracinobacteroides sayramensis TaxID=2913411 RepID=UPI001EDBA7BC|nr:folate-binding protein [Sandaracinobacteroides sayramensis]MCG2840704.1 folate-binding protein [Sandaracinobacteroides sayramensis]
MPQAELSDRALLRLSGPDTRGFLQGLLTQDVAALSPEQPLYAGLLSPQGKALFQLFLFADGEDVLLDAAAEDVEALAKRLSMFRLRKQVAIAPEPALAVWQSWGEGSAHPADPRTPLAGSRYLAAPSGGPGALEGWHAHRLVLGLPDSDEIGRDELLWLETNARELHGVSFAKGCYTGQENTARMHHRDKLRKRLLPLRLSAESAPDAKVMAGEREAGQLRGTRHGDLQMAIFRMDYLAQPLTVDGAAAQMLVPAWLPAEG